MKQDDCFSYIQEHISRVISMGYTGNGERDVRRMQTHLILLHKHIEEKKNEWLTKPGKHSRES